MGRAKLKLQFIENKKSRLQTFKKRKEGLKKKLHQLTTLCDVPACMIIRFPDTNSISMWPEEDSQFPQIRRLIDSYRANPAAVRAQGVSDFFNDNTNELLKKNADQLHLMDDPQLRELGAAMRSRIHFLKLKTRAPEEANKDTNALLDLAEFLDQDSIFAMADAQPPLPEPLNLPIMNNNCDLMLDLDDFGDIVDQDCSFSIADLMNDNAQLQAPLQEYDCPPPLDLPPLDLPPLPQPLDYDYWSSMDVNQNVNWCGLNMDQNLNCS